MINTAPHRAVVACCAARAPRRVDGKAPDNSPAIELGDAAAPIAS
jgi:hypothetical protein